MTPQVAIEIAEGPLRGKQPVIRLSQGLRFQQETIAIQQPALLKVGRALDCQICLPSDDDQVSRHHFLLEIGPSSVRVRDGGSRNGTFVNGMELGQAPENEPARFSHGSGPVELELHDGDHILAGQTVFRVRMVPRAGQADPVVNPNDGQAAENPSARLFRLLLLTTGLVERRFVVS